MKRFFAFMMAICMVAVLAVSAAAADGKYDQSPFAQPSYIDPNTLPQVVDEKGQPVEGITVESVQGGEEGEYEVKGDAIDGCTVTMLVTPYGERSRLVTFDKVDAKDRLEVAREDIDKFDDNFTKWKEIWSKDAPDVLLKTVNRDVAVVSIFDVTIWCDKNHNLTDDTHHHIHYISLTLDEDKLKTFVSLMHFNKNNKWEYVPSKVDYAASTISFTVDCANLSPFAIVAYSEEDYSNIPGMIIAGIIGSHFDGVNDGNSSGAGTGTGTGTGGGTGSGVPTSPQTGKMDYSAYWLSCAIFFAAAGVTAIYRGKKEKQYVR